MKSDDIREKIKCVLEYTRGQELVNIDTSSLVKTTEEFIRNYGKHKIASSYITREYKRRQYKVYPVGISEAELGKRPIKELPDFFVRRGLDIFCFDVKSKSSKDFFGWVNKRAVEDYSMIRRKCDIPVYLNFVCVKDEEVTATGHSSIEWLWEKEKESWDGDLVRIYTWKEGLAHLS